MMKHDVAEEGFEVEAPPVFPNEEVEEDPSIVEGGGGDGRENVIINNDGVPQQQKTWYSKTIGKVAILFVAVFAVCVAIGYGSGYGINEKIHSNKAAASVSSAKNGAYETYDTPSDSNSKTSKVAKSTGPTDTKSSKADGSTKSSKSGGCVSDQPVAEGNVCCAEEECEFRYLTCAIELSVSVCRPPVLIPDGELDCSKTCTIDENCSEGDWCIRGVSIDTCTVESRPSSGTCYDGECRLLAEEPIEEDVPLHRRIELIRNLNAKADASYSVKHNLISTKSCDALIQHIEVAHDHDVDSGIELPTANSEHSAEVEASETYTAFNGGIENQYNQKLSADKIVSLIGKDETKKLIGYFYESLGNLDINSMVLIRHGIPADGGHYDIGWHTDTCETVEVTLNDNYEGGRLLHLNLDGVHRTDTRTGTAIAHSDDVVHGLPSNSDIRYTLVLKHYPGMDGIVKLSHEIVNNMNQ